MDQKYKRFREFRTPFSLHDIRKNPRSMYARVPQAMAQFVLKIEKLSHIMGPTPILEMARAYGLRLKTPKKKTDGFFKTSILIIAQIVTFSAKDWVPLSKHALKNF